MNIIETTRTRLKPTAPEDLEFYRQLFADPVTTQYLPGDKPYDDQYIQNYVNNRVNHWQKGFGTFTVFTRSTTPEPMGYVGVETSPDLNHVDIRYGFLPKFGGQGFATEVGLACLDFMENLGMHKQVYGVAVSENEGSIAVLKKLGMEVAANADFYGHPGLEYFVKTFRK